MTAHKAFSTAVLLQVSAWSQHTTSGLTEVWLDNQGHNYIAECPHGLIAMLRMQLGSLAHPQQQSPAVAAAPTIAAAAADRGKGDAGAPAEATSTDAAVKAADSDAASLWRRCCCTV